MSNWKLAGADSFHEDAQRALAEYAALARDIIKTLPEEEWPQWVKNYIHTQTWGRPKPIDWTPGPHFDALDQGQSDLTLPEEWLSKVAADLSAPANYTPEDPLDLQGKQPFFQSMDTQWWNLPPEEGKRAVVNAFRATMLSPRMNLKGNAILYQSLMNVDPNESDPDVFENIIRALKSQWDAQGQMGLGVDQQDILPLDQILPGRFQPGIWTNIRRVAALGPYADQIYQAAMTDVQQYGGTGQFFRKAILDMNIPGVRAKVASFAWLALSPLTSELGTIDVHMMRHLNQDAESPKSTDHYLQLEDQLRNERDQLYPGTPLTQYQWGVWDKRRTPGFHQDHSPLRPVNPVPYTDVYWANSPRAPRPQQLPEQNPDQMSLMGKIGWSIRKKDQDQDQIQWDSPNGGWPFNWFVNAISEETGIPVTPELHDQILKITQGKIPLAYQNRRNVDRAINWVKTQLPNYQESLIPTQDARDNMAQEHADEFLNGVVPNDSNLRAQYPRQPQVSPNGSPYISGWKRVRTSSGYSIQGQVVNSAPQTRTDGIAVRPDKQSREEIQSILDNLPGHEDDALKQRQHLPDWAVNRGGKVADFSTGPSGIGVTYAPGVILVSEWVDVDDNWILFHDRCVGIIAGKGGATSHGVVVARERNIPIIVNVPQWSVIQPGDQLQMDSSSGAIHGNGGNSTEEFGEAQQALEPAIAFVWSQGNGLFKPIPSGSGGAAILHRPMIRQLKQEGKFNLADYAIGVIYQDGRVQMQGEPSDQELMQRWLNTIHPTTTIESG